MATRSEVVTHFAKTERQLIIAIMVIVGVMSGFLSNTRNSHNPLIPVVIGICCKIRIFKIKTVNAGYLQQAMEVNLSLIGAPGNMIAQSSMEKIGLKFQFFDYESRSSNFGRRNYFLSLHCSIQIPAG